MKEKILDIYNEYVIDAKKLGKEIKNKFKYFMNNFQDNLKDLKKDLTTPGVRKKYIAGVVILVILNLLIINLFISYAYYNDLATIPLIQAKVGSIYDKDSDYVLLVYLENTDEFGNGNKNYHLSNSIPHLGYSFSGYKCNNNSTLIYDEDTKVTSVTLNQREVCSVYFDITSPLDLTAKIMIEESVSSGTYKLSENIPIFGYKYSHYECKNNGNLEYDSKLHKIKLSSSGKDDCNVYFNKEVADIKMNLFVENTLNTEDYIERISIPSNIEYRLNESKSFCKNNKNERIENNITYNDGYINILAQEVSECSVYLDKNE